MINFHKSVDTITFTCYSLNVVSAEMHKSSYLGGVCCGKRKNIWNDRPYTLKTDFNMGTD